jgi:hypothetical protein
MLAPGWAPVSIRFGRKRKPSAQGYLERHDLPLPEDLRGIALSTFGKVIKRGWDWLGLSSGGADRVTGVIEAPALAESLTLSKADFIPGVGACGSGSGVPLAGIARGPSAGRSETVAPWWGRGGCRER